MTKPPPDPTGRRIGLAADLLNVVAMVLVLVAVYIGQGLGTASSAELWISVIAAIVLAMSVVRLIKGSRRR